MRIVWTPVSVITASILSAAQPSWEALEAQGARISAIEIHIEKVFDLSDPKQDTWIGHAANAIHVRTRRGVIANVVAFKVGDLVDARRIHEIERDLRSYRFIKDAHIDPEVGPDGRVVAVVQVHDAWTLKASVSYGHIGGQSTWGMDLLDHNLLGSGKELALRHDQKPDERSTTFSYADRQFLGSRWTLGAAYQSLSDGKGRSLDLGRPFFLLDTPWAVSMSMADHQSTLRIYDHQVLAFSVPSIQTKESVGAAWLVWLEGTSAVRVGVQAVAEDQRYGALLVGAPNPGLGPPDLTPRRVRGPALTASWLQDQFRVYRDLQRMDAPEDYNLGWSGSASLGFSNRTWGATGNGPFVKFDLAKGWAPGPQSLVLAQASFSGRDLDGRVSNTLGNLSVSGYTWPWPRQVFVANLTLDAVFRPDPENLLNLGGLEGLRGYPNYMQLGDRRWVASVEQRMLTDWRWLGMLRAGFVMYADAGAIRRLDGTGWTRPFSDVGGGLRFGDLKSSLARVIWLTVAVPLTRQPGQGRYQVLVGNIARF